MSSIKTTQIDGDVSVGRNVALGGKADIAGSVSIGHNLKVDGWLEAPNIKGANKGVFLTVQSLREAYPNPHDGWMAGVGASTPFTAYIGNGGDWVATGGTIEVRVDMTDLTASIESINILNNAQGTAIQELQAENAAQDSKIKANGYDISLANATGSTLAEYADLAAALAVVPSTVQTGGMTVKFVNSITHKYEQYRLTANAWSTSVGDWERIDEARIKNVEEGVLSDKRQISYKDTTYYLGRGYINTSGILTENSAYVVTNPILLKPYQKISTVESITVNSTYWIFGYDEENETYYVLDGVPVGGSTAIREYTNNTNKDLLIVFQHSLSTSTDVSTYAHQYQIITDTVDSYAVLYNIWQNRQVNGLTVGYISAIGTVTPLTAYESSAYAHLFVPVKKNEIITVSYLRGNGQRAPLAFIESKTHILLGGRLASSSGNLGAQGKFVAPADCLLVIQSNANIDTSEVYIAGVNKDEYLRRMAEDMEDGNLCYRDFESENAVIWNKDLIGKMSFDKNSSLHLLHFSDLHGDVRALQSMIRFGKEYETFIDDMLNTGDTVLHTYSDGTWNDVSAVEGVGNILNTIGNHDGATDTTTTGWEGTPKTDVYNRYLKPYIGDWGVTQPANAEINGYCYYYKDYGTQKIRLIVLDSIMSDYTAQTTWLAGVLADAKTNNLNVVIAQHSPISAGTQMESAYTVGEVASGGFYPNGPAIDAVDDFIEGGGKFICWLCGHTHFDDMRYLPDHNNQLMICVSTAKTQASLRYRRKYSKHQELFNFLSIDPTKKIIRIIRIGAGICYNGGVLDMIGVDYANLKIYS